MDEKTNMIPPVVAIVGRPNVGKSSLFNAVLGRKLAIVHEMSGVTRDRVSMDIRWQGASMPTTLWKSRTIIGNGCGPSTEPMQ